MKLYPMSTPVADKPMPPKNRLHSMRRRFFLTQTLSNRARTDHQTRPAASRTRSFHPPGRPACLFSPSAQHLPDNAGDSPTAAGRSSAHLRACLPLLQNGSPPAPCDRCESTSLSPGNDPTWRGTFQLPVLHSSVFLLHAKHRSPWTTFLFQNLQAHKHHFAELSPTIS